jgi:glutamate dehydrogenase
MVSSSIAQLSLLKHSALSTTFLSCSGYTDPVFEGKADQANQVKTMLKERGFIPPDLAEGEVDWFYQ